MPLSSSDLTARRGRPGPPPPVPGRRTAEPTARAAVLAAVAVVAASALVVLGFLVVGHHPTDLQVYRAGARALLEGTDLYRPDLPTPRGLPFSYPPFAAVVLAPLALLPETAATWLLVAAGIAATLLTCRWALRAGAAPSRDEPGPVDSTGRWRWTAVVTAAVLLLDPLRYDLAVGQLNLLLMALVAADLLLPRTPWPRGLLIGLAAGIKLTPAAFVLYFLVRRELRETVVAVLGFAGTVLVGAVLAPASSWHYFTALVLDPDRPGAAGYATNQSLRGVLTRLGLGEDVVLWGALVALVVVLAAWLAWRARRVGDPLGALLAVAAVPLLCSPVAWGFHWVWAAPLVVWLVRRSRSLPGAVRTATVVAVFAAGPYWLLPRGLGRELGWAGWQQLAGNAYVWLALSALLAAVVHHRMRRPVEADPNASQHHGGLDRGEGVQHLR